MGMDELTGNKRLIVLVPDSLTDHMGLAHKVHWMAIRDHCEVYFLTLIDDEDKMLKISRNMATMKAVTSGNWLVVNSKLIETAHWIRALKEIYHPGDIIACHEEQLVKDGFLHTRPLADFLRARFHAQVAVISGFYQPRQVQTRHWLTGLLFWLGFFLILSLFGLLEVKLSIGAQGLARTFLLIFVMSIELGAIWAWNMITNR